jgi:hypothetical protein
MTQAINQRTIDFKILDRISTGNARDKSLQVIGPTARPHRRNRQLTEVAGRLDSRSHSQGQCRDAIG